MSEKTIGPFFGEWRWLSNFWPVEVEFEGLIYPSTEHAYQSAKTLNTAARVRIASAATPGKAKRFGRLVELRPDWDDVKVEVMLALTREKFKDPELRQKLLDTYPHHLVELNTWGDTFWGVCKKTGKGDNMLGEVLMLVREELVAANKKKDALKQVTSSPIKYEFIVLHEGWEMDNTGWVTEDGRVWLTSHGTPYPAPMAELDELIDRTERSLIGLKIAREKQAICFKENG